MHILYQEATSKYCARLNYTLAALKRYCPASLVAPLLNSEQKKSPFLKSYLYKVNVKSHPSPLCPICNTHTRHTSSLQLHQHTHHIVTPGFVDRRRWSDGTAGQMDGKLASVPHAGRWDFPH